MKGAVCVLETFNRFAPGSFFEIAALSFPLMMNALSVELMLGMNRLILARYSLDAFNAAASVDLFCFTFQFGLVGITTIAEVFADNIWARVSAKMPIAVWQMIWLSLASILFLVPLGFIAGPFLIPESLMDHGLPYFRVLMSTCFLVPLITAVSSFFVVQGRTRLIVTALPRRACSILFSLSPHPRCSRCN